MLLEPQRPAAGPEWVYRTTPNNSARFVLGTRGSNPLVCFGVNPSTAEPQRLDQTLRRVQGYAARNGFDSWLMFNLYPQRSTLPEGMHLTPSAGLRTENEQCVAEILHGRKVPVLAAWGGPITLRKYLADMLEGMVRITEMSSCTWLSIGALTKSGHPRHPSRGPYQALQPFDVHAYLQGLRRLPTAASSRRQPTLQDSSSR